MRLITRLKTMASDDLPLVFRDGYPNQILWDEALDHALADLGYKIEEPLEPVPFYPARLVLTKDGVSVGTITVHGESFSTDSKLIGVNYYVEFSISIRGAI